MTHLALDSRYQVWSDSLHHEFGQLTSRDFRHHRLQSNACQISLIFFLAIEQLAA